MESEKLSPKEATIKAMEQVSSAIIATTLVLLAIFVPVGFLGGITGKNLSTIRNCHFNLSVFLITERINIVPGSFVPPYCAR